MARKRLHDIPANELEASHVASIARFDEMNLRSNLLRGVYDYGLEIPSTIQQRAIEPMIKGNDLVLAGPPNTGKTVSVCISALQMIDPSSKVCQALIATPSRHSAQQLYDTAVQIAKFEDIDCIVLLGGNDTVYAKQQLLIGTPSRVLDMIQKGAITTDSIKSFIVDDADEVLARGFDEEIPAIKRLISSSVKVVFASITMPEDVWALVKTITLDPVLVAAKKLAPPLPGQKHYCISVQDERQKVDILCDLRKIIGDEQILTVCNLRRTLDWLANELKARVVANTAMHGDMTALDRAAMLKDFRAGSIRTLLITNLLARGVDVKASSLVVNYDAPTEVEQYAFRTSSVSTVSLVNPEEAARMHSVEQHYNMRFKRLSILDAAEQIAQHTLEDQLSKLQQEPADTNQR